MPLVGLTLTFGLPPVHWARICRPRSETVRFHWFHLMPYQELPADFSTKYGSVWVDPPASRLYDPVAGHRMYHEYLDELEYADKVGFDGICVNEHHQNAYGLMPSPNLMASALARSTSNAALCVLGNSIALYNPPIRVAEEMAMLDVLSGGRLIAGFPVGTSMDTNFCYGQTPATLRDKYNEAHDLIIRAWTEPDPFVFNGKYTQLRYVNIWPRPLQQPRPPVWIPGAGSVETWESSIANDYLYCYLSFSGNRRGEQVMKGYWDTADRMGADDNPYRAGFLQICAVGETDAEAEKLYSSHVDYFYDKCLHIGPGFVEAPGYRSVRSVEAGLAKSFSGVSDARGNSWKQFLDEGYVVAGSPSTVVDQLKDVIERLHVGHLLLLLHFGDMPREKTMHNTKLFAEEVMPHLKNMWPQWEDRWYPKGLGDGPGVAAPAVSRTR
jgi:alkanesulfonate monooxygenase SsuD/methylene tetrahydromethanopterin reductase-like flavin-dependent oxidoreductase (luciferase family)